MIINILLIAVVSPFNVSFLPLPFFLHHTFNWISTNTITYAILVYTITYAILVYLPNYFQYFSRLFSLLLIA